ncbi:DUF302 domain-containing protein [bacterium]|nr:DUF302 domain-containing protein [bacterium]
MNESMSFNVELPIPFHTAVERVTDALKAEGFGVLTRINIHEAFKQKINVDFRPYTILGACNPQLAHQALTARADVGLLLPCNVTVEAMGPDKSLVRIIDPKSMMAAGGLDSDPKIRDVGEQAYERLQRVAEALV